MGTGSTRARACRARRCRHTWSGPRSAHASSCGTASRRPLPPGIDMPSLHASQRVCCLLVLTIEFSNLYTAVDTPARGRVGGVCVRDAVLRQYLEARGTGALLGSVTTLRPRLNLVRSKSLAETETILAHSPCMLQTCWHIPCSAPVDTEHVACSELQPQSWTEELCVGAKEQAGHAT